MNPLKTIKGTLILGFVTAVVVAILINLGASDTASSGLNKWSLMVWLHAFFGVIWVGLLYYFNFVQTPAMATATADSEGPGPAAIGKYVAPLALLWFRWAALLTWLTGAATLEIMGLGIANTFMLGSRGGHYRGRRLARHYHAVQRLGLDLAEPEENPGNSSGVG